MAESTSTAVPEAASPAELEAAAGHGAGAHDAHGEEHAHPSPLKYVGVAVFLAIVTAVEVGLYYVDMADGVMVFLLVTLAVVKFGFVALYFMHLKFDNRMLRRFFVTGLALALTVYFIVLVTLGVLVG